MKSFYEKSVIFNQFVFILIAVAALVAHSYFPGKAFEKSSFAAFVLAILYLGSLGHAILAELKKLNERKPNIRLQSHDCDD